MLTTELSRTCKYHYVAEVRVSKVAGSTCQNVNSSCLLPSKCCSKPCLVSFHKAIRACQTTSATSAAFGDAFTYLLLPETETVFSAKTLLSYITGDVAIKYKHTRYVALRDNKESNRRPAHNLAQLRSAARSARGPLGSTRGDRHQKKLNKHQKKLYKHQKIKEHQKN